MLASLRLHHEAIEERRELSVSIEREQVRHILIRPHHDHASHLAIDATHGEDVVTALQIRAEHLFIVSQAVASFVRQQESGHRLKRELAMGLLEDGADVDHGIDVGPVGRVAPDRRVASLGEEVAQAADGRGPRCRVAAACERVDASASVGFSDMAEVNGLGIRQTNDRRRMEALTDQEAPGEMLIF